MSKLTKYLLDPVTGLWFEIFVKIPLRQAIVSLLERYPEPTRGDCGRRNSLVWLDIRDKYLRDEQNPSIKKMAKVFFDLIICEQEHDPPYEERIDEVIKLIVIAYLSGEFALRGRPPADLWDKTVTPNANEQLKKLMENKK